MAARIGKHKPTRRIDRPATAPGGVASGEGSGFTAPPATPTPPAPSGLTLATALSYSAVTPTARITATWSGMESYDLETYAVQISTDPTFATDMRISTTAPNQTSISIDNLRTLTTYYVRVRTVVGTTPSDWSAAASITTGQDLVPPAAVSGVAWQWLGNGDLVLTWSPPTSANYKDAELRIWASSTKTLLLRTLTGRTGATYTAAMNYADTSNAPLAAVYVEVLSRSYSTVYGPLALPPNQPSKDAPATPSGLTSSWAGDDGTAGADCILRWNSQSDAVRYRLTIDGVARELASPRTTYGLDANVSEHSGIPDPSLALTLLAIDGLGQVSRVAASGYAVNARPPTTSVQIAPGFSTIGVALTASAAADLKDYRLRIVKDGQTAATARSTDLTIPCDISPYGAGSYQIGVSVVDVFEQVSTETLSAAVLLEPLTIADLRVDAGYDDDMTSAQATLATLKDTLTASGGVFYP